MANPIEVWKADKHGLDVWPDIEAHARAGTAMKEIDSTDLERMKWYGFFYRKRDRPGRYMNRIRITAGELTAEQAREIARIAYEMGHGIVDITTRANLQVQGLEIGHLPKVAARLEDVGLTSKQTGHDNIRNVFAHPFSGLIPDELIDTRQLCHDVTELFIDSREYSDLPRKLNICLNGTSHHSAHFWTQDISYLATTTDDGEVMFQVLIGGTQGQNPLLAQPLPVLVRPDQVVDVTRSIMDLFRAKGSREKRNAARLRFLIEEIGIAGVLDWLEDTLPFPLQPVVGEPAPATSHDELIGWFRQSDPKLWTMGLSVPLGRMTWRQLEGVALLSRRWGDGQLRTTHEQGLAVINIPSGFRDAAATDAAALGLSVHADVFDRNTMACTGSQFCNIAVTETKGQMLQLIERLRKKALMLHGIRIHMSGCPSSCAQHFTADIGLKGVRVRRLIGTREGFDVFLGGGITGQVHMALPYRLGVDVDQLPNLVEEVVNEYYLKHRSGQTFSAYWREKLKAAEASKVGDADYSPPVWLCESCEHRHVGEDPPVFCPSCAGLRRNFARLEDGTESGQGTGESESSKAETSSPAAPRADGFRFAAKLADISAGEGHTVEVAGREFALFREGETVHALDAACPHEGAPLAEGEFANGTVTCPWHGWTFNACTGCSIDPPDQPVASWPVLIEDGNVLIKVEEAATGGTADAQQPVATTAAASGEDASPPKPPSRAVNGVLNVLEIIDESPDVRTFRLDNSAARLPLDFPGRFAKVCATVDGREVWRSFTISSSPTNSRTIDLTIKRNPAGEVSNWLFDHITTGSSLRIKGPQGGFYFDPDQHTEPLVLISAGSGVTPMMAIARFLNATGNRLPCTFLYGARTPADILFHDECSRLGESWPGFRYFTTLSQPTAEWSGSVGRLSFEHLAQNGVNVAGSRYFLCGPDNLMDSFRTALHEAGVDPSRIHSEQFHAIRSGVTV